MQRVDILARGDVQRVGIRDVVQRIARNLGISGMVQNQGPFDVRIVAEGQEDALKEFVRSLRIQKRPIQVRELEVSWAAATGEFPYFKIMRGSWQEELEEGLDVIVELLRMWVDVNERFLKVNKESLSERKTILDMQEQTLDEI